jgi:hypothetical protein
MYLACTSNKKPEICQVELILQIGLLPKRSMEDSDLSIKLLLPCITVAFFIKLG